MEQILPHAPFEYPCPYSHPADDPKEHPPRLPSSEAFDQFIGQHTNLSSRQLEFLNLLKGFLIEREKIEKKDLISAPFTVIHPQGIRGVFSPAEINEILQLTERLAA